MFWIEQTQVRVKCLS